MTITRSAQRLDVGHVVAGQQDRRPVARGVGGDEGADAALGGDVEPERRLVQEEHPRPVQQRAGDLALHPLAEREVADRLAQQLPEVEQLDQLVERRPGTRAGGMR